MKPINLKTKLLAFAVASFGMISTEAAAQNLPRCTSTSSSASGTSPVNGTPSCLFTPKSTELKIYSLAICEEAPAIGSNEGCAVLFSDPAGRTVTINGTSSNLTLSDDISIAEGTYKYGVIHISNEIGFNASFSFTSNRSAKNITNNGLNGNGTVCYTNGTKTSEIPDSGQSIVMNNTTCGDSDLSRTSVHRGAGALLFPAPYNKLTGTSSEGSFSAHFLDADNNPATINFQGQYGHPNNSTNAKSIWALQTFYVAPTVSPNTTNIDLSILMTDAMRMRFDGDGSIGGMNLWQFGVKVSVN